MDGDRQMSLGGTLLGRYMHRMYLQQFHRSSFQESTQAGTRMTTFLHAYSLWLLLA